MIDADDERSSCTSGCITPPLSPTKTISSEDWASPRTPRSPRKSRSCIFFGDIDSIVDNPLLTPPASPTKSKSISRLRALPTSELFPRSCDHALLRLDQISPVQRSISPDSEPSSNQTVTSNCLHTHVLPRRNKHLGEAFTCPVPDPEPDTLQNGKAPKKLRRAYRSLSDSRERRTDSPSAPRSFSFGADVVDNEGLVHLSPNYFGFVVEDCFLPNKPCKIPLRSASSPLRPCQWAARGGFSSSSYRHQKGISDRFIASRRPSVVTRESFELNKPAERLEAEQMTRRNRRLTSDPFQRRLRRSERLNDELRGLREANSIISGRAGANQRNANFQRSYFLFSTRQISAGAIWNVGGPSAVSDTVVGVSTGNGGMLGIRTNAPLYKSAFLNRADPEAELEAYERRLALALNVDQTGRVLQHSPIPPYPLNAKHGSPTLSARPVWRDGGWMRDGVVSRLLF